MDGSASIDRTSLKTYGVCLREVIHCRWREREAAMGQRGFFDVDERLAALSRAGDPLRAPCRLSTLFRRTANRKSLRSIHCCRNADSSCLGSFDDISGKLFAISVQSR